MSPANYRVVMGVRIDLIDYIGNRQRKTGRWNKGWQASFAGRKAQHCTIGSFTRQSLLDLDEEACKVQPDGLDCATRSVTWMLHGPAIYAEAMHDHQFWIGIFARHDLSEGRPAG